MGPSPAPEPGRAERPPRRPPSTDGPAFPWATASILCGAAVVSLGRLLAPSLGEPLELRAVDLLAGRIAPLLGHPLVHDVATVEGLALLLFGGLLVAGPGRDLERAWGPGRVLLLVAVTSVVAGGAHLGLTLESPGVPTAGLLGTGLALVVARTLALPRRPILGIRPLHALVPLVSVALVLALAQAVGERAQIGQILAGLAVGAVASRVGPLRRRLALAWHTHRSIRQLRYQDRLQASLDRLLVKIHEEGMEALDARERRLLEDASELSRMSRETREASAPDA